MQLIRYFALIATLAIPTHGGAEEGTAPALRMELNAADTFGEGCRLTFLLQNALSEPIDKLVAETVLFSSAGQVVLLTLFDFGALPVDRPRVRQFNVPDMSCDGLGQVLVNGLSRCEIGGVASSQCEDHLEVTSRVPTALEG